MKLSVNLNKIALLRNARGENYPELSYFANKAIDLGVNGLTLHPRPDHRHATSDDVIEISKICKERGAEFNICLLYTSPSPRDLSTSRMPSSA